MISATKLKEISNKSIDLISEEIGRIIEKIYTSLEPAMISRAEKGLYNIQFFIDDYITENIRLNHKRKLYEILSDMLGEEGYSTKWVIESGYIQVYWDTVLKQSNA